METISFYSYKGGAGRSSTALNTLPYLVNELGATKNNPILLLDMDLDSAGMTYLLSLDNHFQTAYDIKEFLKSEESWSEQSVGALSDHPFYKKFVPVGDKLGVDNDAVMFLGANDATPIDNSQMGGAKEEVFKKLNRFCRKNGIKAVVIDSSAGDQFSALLSTQASSVIVCCMRPTMQFRIGTFNYLHRLAKNNSDKRIVILPTVVPMADREVDGEYQIEKAVNNILERIDNLDINNVCADFITTRLLGINEVERFKWKEGVLYKILKNTSLKEDELEATNRYQKLAHILADGDKL